MEEQVKAANLRLGAACVPYRVRLNKQGRYLTIRGMLPCKPGDGLGRKQYDLSLALPATKAGLKRAEGTCHKLSDEVAEGSFLWSNWQNPRREKPDEPPELVRDLIERFKVEHLKLGRCKESTWKQTWGAEFRRLPQDVPLTEAALLAVVLGTKPGRRSRQMISRHMAQLASFAGLDVDLSIYGGDYNRNSLAPRKLPSDKLIEQVRLTIPNESWRWQYGICAAFGLRPHEAFFCEFEDSESLHVVVSKTYQHTAKALRPDWVRDWGLMDIQKPPVKAATLRGYGQRVGSQMRRYKLPFQPYDLRHAYSIRGVWLGFNPPEMARWMGHSEKVHQETYRRWLDKMTTDAIYERKMGDWLIQPDA